MDLKLAVEKLHRQLEIIPSLRQARDTRSSDPSFKKWDRDTKTAIGKIFGEQSNHVKEFDDIYYSLGIFSSSTPDSDFYKAYLRGLESAAVLLESMIDEIKEYGLDESNSTNIPDALSLIEILCIRFHRFARQLQARYDNRPTIDIEDEYDLQDVFHALLRLHFDDVRKEEYSPSYASASSRIDFILKNEQIVIELKKTRPTLKAKEVGEQLIVDIARYAEHPDCKCLVCFVYDPENKIPNPDGLESDLERLTDRFKVRVIIAPKN